MNKDFSVQCFRSSKVYDTKQEAIDVLKTIQSSDGSIVLARYKDSTGVVKTLIAPNCNLDGISDPGLKAANYTIYDPDVVGKVDPNSGGTGEIFNDYENNKATGQYSHAEGHGTTASGKYSHAEGNSTATGECSHAEGQNTTASGSEGSHAEGLLTIASGSSSHAEGNGTTASGRYSHAEGSGTTTQNDYEHAQGSYNKSNTGTSDNQKTIHSIGIGTLSLKKNAVEVMANGDVYINGLGGYDGTNYSSAKTLQESIPEPYTLPTASSDTLGGIKIGNGIKIDGSGVASAVGMVDTNSIGNGEIFNYYSVTYKNKATGQYSHAEGYNATASGFYSHAEGRDTHASSSFSHAEGYYTTASGDYGSHAEGFQTTASGDYGSHADGHNTTASGIASHAEGSATTASGTVSHAEGSATTAAAYCQHVQGKYNTIFSSESPTTYSATTRAFIIGNGTTDSAKGDAFYVLFNGETHADGAYSGSGADYAEMFEWSDGNTNKEDRVGYFVTLDNDKIRLANQNDNYILGIVSGSPMVIGNNPMRWQGKYLDDEWGRPVYENIEYDEQVPMTPDDEGYDPESKEPQMKIVKRQAYVRKQNPEWNGTQEYSLRTNRDEWACVGLMGQLLVRQDGTLKAGGFCKVSESGIATNSDYGYYVMKVNSDSQALVMFN